MRIVAFLVCALSASEIGCASDTNPCDTGKYPPRSCPVGPTLCTECMLTDGKATFDLSMLDIARTPQVYAQQISDDARHSTVTIDGVEGARKEVGDGLAFVFSFSALPQHPEELSYLTPRFEGPQELLVLKFVDASCETSHDYYLVCPD